MSNVEHLSIYVHIPFCRTRCFYCDFNTYAGQEKWVGPYVESLIHEMEMVARRVDGTPVVHSIYFGGGTPSMLPAEMVAKINWQIRCSFNVMEQAEISMEMNPVRLTEQYLEVIQQSGVNRISLGMQSASLEELRLLGRRHRFEDVQLSVERARRAGIENINLDIIFGLPAQTCASFEGSLEAAVDLHPPHLSLYALTVENGTRLAEMIRRCELPAPDEDLAADMYVRAVERLPEAGYKQYEISNWALTAAHECLHNLQYWHNAEYLGFGAGAHSHYGQWRWENVKGIQEYIEKVNAFENTGIWPPAVLSATELRFDDDVGEMMMMGLRLTEEGINEDNFSKRFGVGLTELYEEEINLLMGQGLLEWVNISDGRHLRLTPRGRMLGNQVFMQFLKD